MSMFPPIGLLNRFYLGDTVLLEGLADTLVQELDTDVCVISEYPELFEHHPRVRGISSSDPQIAELRVIDMTDSIKSIEDVMVRGKRRRKLLPGKLNRMWKQAGLSESHIHPSRLYLSPEEQVKAGVVRSLHPGKCVGVVLRSRHQIKTWPYTKWLIKHLRREGYQVFIFTDALQPSDAYLSRYGVCQVVGKPLRELMVYLAAMDVVVGSDTGPMHIAATLGISTVVVTMEWFRDLWDIYENCSVLARRTGKWAMHSIGPRKVVTAVNASISSEVAAPVRHAPRVKKSPIALFRLDGMGGTLTLADQAKKIFEATEIKSDLIIRGYAELFKENPYINDIVEVGHVRWEECITEMRESYETVAEVRFAPAKWHQKGKQWFEQDFERVQGIFDEFPHECRRLEIHDLHHVQLTDRYLGLPYDTIDIDFFASVQYKGELPEGYLVVANGVDVCHNGLRQTKTWDGFDSLVSLIDMPVVQVGTLHDPRIQGTVDLRGSTTLAEVADILQKADAVLCTEGGIMHLSYAVKVENVFIPRGPTRGKLFEYPGQHYIDSYVCEICWSSTPDWFAKCPKDIDSVCMKTITPERVAMNIQGVLS